MAITGLGRTYLRDVLILVDTHPAQSIDELLPHRWQPPLTKEGASQSVRHSHYGRH